MDLTISRKQHQFVAATADEVLFGGAAGGGKSYGQLIDAMLYALKYPGSKQLILRRTYPDLERSLVRASMDIYPRDIYKYNSSTHTGRWANGSIIDFGYCDNERDVYQYQGAEYDTIRFDELTHFSEFMYVYLISRLRGANVYPKQIKSATNPGGVGHQWVKDRFISPVPPNTLYKTDRGSRIFIPSKVEDNKFLLEADPEYLTRLENLPEKERRALLLGDWDIFEGQYFAEWRREIHTIKPFDLPADWRRYVALDYGFDMLAVYWIAVDWEGKAYVYREYCEGMHLGEGHQGLMTSDAIQAIKDRTAEDIYAYLAPPDLWGRKTDTGKSTAEQFAQAGIPLVRAQNSRVMGWMDLHEWLKPYEDKDGAVTANLVVFDTCVHLIRCLPALQHDSKNPNDCSIKPHEITHAPDAIRYFVAGRPRPGRVPQTERPQPFGFMRPKPNPGGRGEKVKVI